MNILAYEEKNLAKIQKKNDKKLLWSLVESEREKKVLKKMFEQVKSKFFFFFLKKAHLQFSIDRNRQKLTENFKRNFESKTDWINRKYGKTEFQRKTT